MRIKREYQSWVANETLEDYALRYAARSYRRWTPFTLANTALGGASFLALEAIGASVTLSFGFQNAFPAIVLVCVLIFLIGLPVAYYASVSNVDIDLLTRGAGFGYVGSTVTSLIYASFTFIFFALESAILAQALAPATGLDLTVGYLICSLVIVPLVFFGVTLINKLQMWTQPLWVVLLVLPFISILHHDPHVLAQWAAFTGRNGGGSPRFDLLAFGAAAGVLFSLVGQIGEQVDYLRFLPERTRENRVAWWSALLLAGPGWILIGGLKVLAGSLLAVLAIGAGVPSGQAMEPIHMYLWAYGEVFERHEVVLAAALLFVLVSQIKINVTNAYAGSLAWSNVFVRLTHYHPGRVVWLVFNVVIALLLTLLGIFSTLEAVLSVYANLVIAWLGALAADLMVLKPLGISPREVEFRRAYLHAFNPVGCGAMVIASLAGVCAYAGLFGPLAQAYSAFISLLASFASAIAIAFATGGRYYIARDNTHYREQDADETIRCCVCERDYEAPDMAHCPFYQGPICSLCCGLDNHCHDACKRPGALDAHAPTSHGEPARVLAPSFTGRLTRFFGLFLIAAAAMGAIFLLAWRLMSTGGAPPAAGFGNLLLRTYTATLPLLAFGAWWIVLTHESRELARAELVESLRHLESARKTLVESEKMASLGGLVAGVAHEINTPVGIVVSAASYLQDRTDAASTLHARGALPPAELERYFADAAQSARLLLSNANRAAQLVQSFKQVAVDQTSEKRRSFDLGDYLRDTLLSLEPRLRDTRVSLLIDCPAGIVMDSYPGPIAQIATNLVMNSLQHGFADGRAGIITISARQAADDEVVIRHGDDGCGIPRALHGKIFEPFFTSRRGQGGSGLGLHLVYNLITQRLCGTISVEDRDGGGVTFLVQVPRVTPSAKATIPVVPTGNPS